MPSFKVNGAIPQSGPRKLGYAAEPAYRDGNPEESEGKPLSFVIKKFP